MRFSNPCGCTWWFIPLSKELLFPENSWWYELGSSWFIQLQLGLYDSWDEPWWCIPTWFPLKTDLGIKPISSIHCSWYSRWSSHYRGSHFRQTQLGLTCLYLPCNDATPLTPHEFPLHSMEIKRNSQEHERQRLAGPPSLRPWLEEGACLVGRGRNIMGLTGWRLPVICLFLSPIDYSYIYHKP